VFRKRPEGELTTRGWNGYSGNEVRAFKYLTEKKRLTARDLSPALLNSKSFHFICGGARCLTEVMQILDLRREENEKNKQSSDPNIPSPRPLIVWEPVPDLCVPLALPETCRVLCMIDVISPNHAELGAFFEYTHPETHVDRETVEAHAQQFIAWGIGRDKKGAIVVRCGAEGCYVQNSEVKRWLPAYHTSEDSSHANDDATNSSGKVVDPTGGGNGFLGGLAVGMVRSGGDIVEAALWGSIAASYCIEQVGMPELTAGADNAERWNGTVVRERLEEFRKRVDLG
jgi:sugar/nucleoside kinase (ribokinase family)